MNRVIKHRLVAMLSASLTAPMVLIVVGTITGSASADEWLALMQLAWLIVWPMSWFAMAVFGWPIGYLLQRFNLYRAGTVIAVAATTGTFVMFAITISLAQTFGGPAANSLWRLLANASGGAGIAGLAGAVFWLTGGRFWFRSSTVAPAAVTRDRQAD